MKAKSKKEEVTDLIDEIIAPKKMSQEDAIDFLREIEDFCRGLAEGIQNDIDMDNEE
jgi:hypothetical protein